MICLRRSPRVSCIRTARVVKGAEIISSSREAGGGRREGKAKTHGMRVDVESRRTNQICPHIAGNDNMRAAAWTTLHSV